MPNKITVIYDNNTHDPNLDDAWGFSALIQDRGRHLLFDTGGDGSILLGNMQKLGIDPKTIEAIVLSHNHSDHTGGLLALLELGIQPVVYILPSFPSEFKHKISELTTVVNVSLGQSLTESIFTSGEIDASIPEQALAVKTGKGIVIMTGCAHPGIVNIVERIKSLLNNSVYLVMGGFHLGMKSESNINVILAEFRRLGVKKAAPCHCSGNKARAMFAAEYGKDYLNIGVGSIIEI